MHPPAWRRRALRLAALSLLLLPLVLGVACGDDDDEPGTATPADTATEAAAFPVTITDSSGATVTVAEAPARILSYSPAITEILFAIGAGDQVVAVDEFSNYPPEAVALQKLTYSDPAPEQAVAEEPDLVFMSGRQEGQVEQFRALELTVVFLEEPPDVAGILQQIRDIGRLTGHAGEAEALADSLQARIDAIAEKLESVDEGPRVFVELTPDLYTVAPESFIGGLLTLVKAKNIAAGATSAFPQLSAEVVIDEDPEVIILTDGTPDSGGQSLETLRARPGWDAITAVKEGRVHAVDPDIFSRPGPRIVDALEELVALLYPDLAG